MDSTDRRSIWRSRSETARDLRKFGFGLAVALTSLGLLSLWRSRPVAPYVLTAAVLFACAALVAPRRLAPIKRIWMSFAEKFSTVVTIVILALTFCLVITPIGVLMRLLKRDVLGLQLDRTATSYWISTDPHGPGSRPDKPY